MPECHLDQPAIRIVGGELISSTVAVSSSIRVEVLRRSSPERVYWHFRQPKPALVWFRRGVQRSRLSAEGRPSISQPALRSDLCFVPAGITVEGEFDIRETCDYAIVFIDRALVAASCGPFLDRPLIGFGQEELRRGLAILCAEAAKPDPFYGLFAEGWAMQALAILARVSGSGTAARGRPSIGGLSGRTLRQVIDLMRARISEPVTISELAVVAGLSPRHFMRALRGQHQHNCPRIQP